jgi:hypothetical protein
MAMENFSKHQQGIIKRYYANQSTIVLQRLSELVTELYLAEGKKRDKLWTTAEGLLKKLEVPADRITHVVGKKDLTLIAKLVQELSNSIK